MDCKAKTQKGNQCKKEADDTGYCSIHRKKEFKMKDEKEILDKIYTVVKDTCSRSEWFAYRESYDTDKFRFFSVNVSKQVQGRFGRVRVNAELYFRITSENKLVPRINERSHETNGLENLLNDIMDELKHEDITKSANKTKNKYDDIDYILSQIFKRFHMSTQQLLKRYDERSTLTIRDEYDVQDYLNAILKIFFSDVRSEEYSPSVAGKNSRLDFLLKDEQIVIETKMTRKNLKDKKLGEELIIDIERYQKHPDCKRLICFVYDPEYYLANPYGLEKDLSGQRNKINVSVFIYPK